MDKLDRKILLELMNNSKIPLTQLAKKLKRSREMLLYRIERLKETEVIIDFVTEINLEKLGFVGAAVFLTVKSKADKKFREYLVRSPYVSWVAEHSGIWNYGLSFYGKNKTEVNKRIKELHHQFKEDITNYRTTFHRNNHFFYEKYFSSIIRKSKKKVIDYNPDKLDIKILEKLSLNSRLDSVQLTKSVPLTAQAIRDRIRKLESSGIIKKYSIFVDVSKLGAYQYNIFIDNGKNNVLSYLTEHPKVSFIAEYENNPFLEFGVFINNPYDLRKILQEIEEVFPDNKILEVSLFQQELVSIGPPKCVFE